MSRPQTRSEMPCEHQNTSQAGGGAVCSVGSVGGSGAAVLWCNRALVQPCSGAAVHRARERQRRHNPRHLAVAELRAVHPGSGERIVDHRRRRRGPRRRRAVRGVHVVCRPWPLRVVCSDAHGSAQRAFHRRRAHEGRQPFGASGCVVSPSVGTRVAPRCACLGRGGSRAARVGAEQGKARQVWQRVKNALGRGSLRAAGTGDWCIGPRAPRGRREIGGCHRKAAGRGGSFGCCSLRGGGSSGSSDGRGSSCGGGAARRHGP